MTQPDVSTSYSTIAPLFGAMPGWIPSLEQQRIASYNAYEEVYWNTSQVFKIMMRGGDAEEDVIYVPRPRTIIETVNRYVGVDLDFNIDQTTGTPASRTAASEAFKSLFAREAFYSKYNSNKRFGLIRGDWLWHVLADASKPQGSRLSILPVHPGNYFPVFESDEKEGGSPDKIVEVHLAEQIVVGDDTVVRRQTYRKEVLNGVVTIYSSMATFKPDEWATDGKPIQILIPEFPLDSAITAIPVYHVPNFSEPGNPYGSSELRGFERLLAAINQAFTDEDITLALEGLGVYATDSNARPIDKATGEVTDWSVYPGRVIQNAAGFKRVEGVSTVVPYGDHIERMVNELKEASGANDAASGRVDVNVAESGIALLLHLAPILAKAKEKDRIILDVHGQMFFDLRAWLKVYEGINIDDVMAVPILGDKLPKNHKNAVELVTLLMSTIPPVLSAQSARVYLESEGLKMFASDEAARVEAEQAKVLGAADPLGERAASELNGNPEDDTDALDSAGGTGA